MYFNQCSTVPETKSLYRELAFDNHPDRGGDTEEMQKINASYEIALKSFDGQTMACDDGKTRTYVYRDDIEKEIIEKIDHLLTFLPDDVELLLVGTWIWLSGNTYPIKDMLGKKGANMRYNGKEKMWCFGKFAGRYRKSGSFSDIAQTYGYEVIKKPTSKKPTLVLA